MYPSERQRMARISDWENSIFGTNSLIAILVSFIIKACTDILILMNMNDHQPMGLYQNFCGIFARWDMALNKKKIKANPSPFLFSLSIDFKSMLVMHRNAQSCYAYPIRFITYLQHLLRIMKDTTFWECILIRLFVFKQKDTFLLLYLSP